MELKGTQTWAFLFPEPPDALEPVSVVADHETGSVLPAFEPTAFELLPVLADHLAPAVQVALAPETLKFQHIEDFKM